MTGQLDPTGQRILRAYTWWSVARILADPKAGVSQAVSGQYGASHYPVPGLPNDGHPDGSWHMTTTPKGIALASGWTAAQTTPAHLLRWPDVTAHARALPKDIRARLADAMREHGEHRATYRPFRVTAYAQGCGPSIRVHRVEGPETPQRTAYEEQQDAWALGWYRPWSARLDALQAAVEHVLDDCLPLATAEPVEPTDLLALLEQMEPA